MPGIKNKLSFGEAEEILESTHTRIKADIIANNFISLKVDLMVIIPAYNVEQYIEQCIDSILNQKTQYSYKIVIVNDGSTDLTSEILKKYSGNNKIEIIHQENRGFSGARNRALENIMGEYIIFVDADDMLNKDSIDLLMRTAIETGSDIVEGGFVKIDENNNTIETESKQKCEHNDYKDFRDEPWGKVIRSEVFRYLKFPEQYWFEDSIFPYIIYPLTSKKQRIREMVYQYRHNSQGITVKSKFEWKAIDTVWIVLELLEIIEEKEIHISEQEMQKMLLKQLKTNQIRLRLLDLKIQKAAFFVLSSTYFELYDENTESDFTKKEKAFCKTIRKQDFNKFKLLCKF